MRLREIRRSPAQHLDFLLGGLDPAHRGSQLSRVGRRGPDPLPSSMSAFFNHEYNVVKWIPKSFAIFVAGEQCPNRRRGSARVEAMDLRSLIARGSVRSFGPEPVPRQVVQFLVDQARWTGSARNGQPWRFVAVYDQCVRAELARCGAYAGHLENAPVALVLLSPATHRYDTEFDLGRVAQSITLAAAEQGLGCCITSLYPDDNALTAAKIVSAEPGWTARHAMALGSAAASPTLGRSAIPVGRRDTTEILQWI
jgi:nitroreductase